MTISWRKPDQRDMQRDLEGCYPTLLLWLKNDCWPNDPFSCATTGNATDEGAWDINGGDSTVPREAVLFVADIQPPTI